MPSPQRSISFFLANLLVSLLFLASRARSQTAAQNKTDEAEAKVLNQIFDDWETSSPFFNRKWNRNEDLCNSTANGLYIACDCKIQNDNICHDCKIQNDNICHVVHLNATDLEIEGQIPYNLSGLLHLRILNFHGNYFSGSLPAFIGNMTELQTLDLGSNILNGTIPKELGRLQKLVYLDIGINKFSGSLPEELGNLTNLQQLRINSINANGLIPSYFGKLDKLQTLWISDNDFTGGVPSFIERCFGMKDLRLQGNKFQGPIPPGFAHLTNLTQLRIGEVDGSSGLLDIKNMKSLEILILRNNNISGTIPDDFGQYSKLRYLDLSFNDLSGPVPELLLNMPNLEYLSLENNSLAGTLPSKRNASYFMDLSYNNISGSFPPWLNNSYNLNLVGNNFKDDSLNHPSGLGCLQMGFPSHISPPIYSIAINSGGSKSVNTSEGLYYEEDGKSLEDVPFYVSNGSNWAVVSSGRFLDVAGPTYIQSIQSVFEKTQNPDLFSDMRLSASSLRYYGLGLANGNYNVTLYFGETLDYWDYKKGIRLFDIYIQGKRVEQDFDITKKAGGSPKTAVRVNLTAVVTENYLEIHLFWAGKGTCCAPNRMSYGPTISALDLNTEKPTAGKKSKVPLIAGISAAFLFLLIMFVIGVFIWRWNLRRAQDEEFLALTIKPKMFSYEELKSATGDFDQSYKLGQGGFGSVFKGIVDGDEVAVKKLAVSSAEGKIQFITEVATVSTVQHRNLVKLLGCCCEGKKRLLVYEYLVNRSLDKVLFGKTDVHLDWASRFKICLGTARGLAYLHEESSTRIIHRDVKASNILLDADLNPKISDFGLAKPYDEKITHISTRVAGTIGYLAPEYALRGQLTEKADVFGFGVVAFEILCGRPNTEEDMGAERKYLLDWVWQLHEKKSDLEMMDPTLSSYDQEEALRVIKVAFMCTQASAAKRPPMTRVVAMLVGDMDVVEIHNRPSYLMDWKYPEKFSSSSTSFQSKFTVKATTQLLSTIDEGR